MDNYIIDQINRIEQKRFTQWINRVRSILMEFYAGAGAIHLGAEEEISKITRDFEPKKSLKK